MNIYENFSFYKGNQENVRNNIIKGCKKELFIENAEVTK